MADKEAARKSPMEMVVFTAPDVCLTPAAPSPVPIPYPIFGMMSTASGTADSVKLTGMSAFTKAATIPKVMGDEAGTATGVKSGTVMSKAAPDQSSSTVYAEGEQVCRHDDLFAMNNDNTKGKLVCTEVGPPSDSASGSDEKATFDEVGELKGDPDPPVVPETPQEQSWWASWKETVHTSLDVAGMVPVVGEFADAANAVLYLASGDVVNAGISAAALLPVGGQAATGGRLAYKGGKEVLQAGAKEGGQAAATAGAKEAGQKAAGGVPPPKAPDAPATASAGGGGGQTPPPGSPPPPPPGGTPPPGGGPPGGGKPPGGEGGGPKTPKKPDDPDVNAKSPDQSKGDDGVSIAPRAPKTVGHRKDHILNGHKHGAGKGGKSEFPADWNDDKIVSAVEDVANNADATKGVGKWDSPYSIAKVDGVEIRVDFYPETHPKYPGQISTAYPINSPLNP